MKTWKLKSIQRWENDGGALLPRDCNVHLWNYQQAEPDAHLATDNRRGRTEKGAVLYVSREGQNWSSNN